MFISDHYDEEDKGIVKESKALFKNKAPMTKEEIETTMTSIKDSIVENGGAAKEQENLIIEHIGEVRKELANVVNEKMSSGKTNVVAAKYRRRTNNRRLTRQI